MNTDSPLSEFVSKSFDLEKAIEIFAEGGYTDERWSDEEADVLLQYYCGEVPEMAVIFGSIVRLLMQASFDDNEESAEGGLVRFANLLLSLVGAMASRAAQVSLDRRRGGGENLYERRDE